MSESIVTPYENYKITLKTSSGENSYNFIKETDILWKYIEDLSILATIEKEDTTFELYFYNGETEVLELIATKEDFILGAWTIDIDSFMYSAELEITATNLNKPLENPTKSVSGFSVASQILIDDRTVFVSKNELEYRIFNTDLPFRLPLGQRVWLAEENASYIWQINRGHGDTTKLLAEGFIYPANLSINGFDYSNKTFNFYPVSQGSLTPPLPPPPVWEERYIGEAWGGGVIFHIEQRSDSSRWAFIVDTTETSTSSSFSNVTGTAIGSTAQSAWNGSGNSTAIVSQMLHTTSAAKLCLDRVANTYDDWYLPAINELGKLRDNLITVNRALSEISGGVTLFPIRSYISSTEMDAGNFAILQTPGAPATVPKTTTNLAVRAIRKQIIS